MKYLVGIDEVGRGPVAGPLAVGVFVVSELSKGKLLKFFPNFKIKDSKKLSSGSREIIFNLIKKRRKIDKLLFVVSFVSQTTIDRKGISYSLKLAIRRSLSKLKLNPLDSRVVLDGGLKAPDEFLNQKTIIKGDEKEPVIALASIVAKVLRDRRMVVLSKKYPQYGFETHKGYGTALHYNAISKHGVSVLHRKSFLKSYVG